MTPTSNFMIKSFSCECQILQLKCNMKFDGKPFRFDIWVGGEPVPSIEWFRNDVKVVNDGSTNVNVYTKSSSAYTLKNAVLSVPKVSSR